MKSNNRSKHLVLGTLCALGVFAAAETLIPAAQAGPPPWAPAHGYRAKFGKPHYHHYHTAPAPHYRTPYRLQCNNDTVGALVGGALGGWLGSQFGKGSGQLAATAGGAVFGMLVGQSIGRHMNEVDRRCAGQVLDYAPDRQPVMWHNPHTQAQYTVTPVRSFTGPQGRYCREYTTQALVGGRTQEVYGTACWQPDGSWEVI